LEGLYQSENTSRRVQDRVLDRSAFKLMIGQVTHMAIELMSIELAALMALQRDDDEAVQRLASAEPPICQCDFTLPI